MFNYLTESGYSIIYKRPKNTEFPLDQNEQNSLNQGFIDIEADVEGIGRINDYQLTKYYDNIFLLDDIVNNYSEVSDIKTYNEIQLKLFSGSSQSTIYSKFRKYIRCYF